MFPTATQRTASLYSMCILYVLSLYITLLPGFQAAVAVGKKIYGSTGSLLLSQAHLAVARSLVVSQAFSGEEYYSEAQAAWRMAMEVLPPDHPRLAVYRYTQGRGAGGGKLLYVQ